MGIKNWLIKKSSHKAVTEELNKGSDSDVINRLGELSNMDRAYRRSIKKAIEKNAPKEMDKAIAKFKKKGIPVTTSNLLKEVKSNIEFQSMCRSVGIEIDYFENLAKLKAGECIENRGK